MENTFSDTESILESDIKGNGNNNEEREVNNCKLLSTLLATESEVTNQKKATKKQSNQSEIQKRANLPDKFFDHIHYAPYWHLFSLTWYDNMTYAIDKTMGLGKNLLIPCCNGLSCMSIMLEILQREPFIEILPIKYSEIDRK